MAALGLILMLAGEPRIHGWTCEAVRAEVSRLGRVMAYAHAIAHGLTPSQIKEIRRRCKV